MEKTPNWLGKGKGEKRPCWFFTPFTVWQVLVSLQGTSGMSLTPWGVP